MDKINVSELCRIAGVTRKTFYLHYENITVYFEEIVEGLLVEIENAMKRTTDYRLMSNERLNPKMIHIFEHVYDNKAIYQIVFSGNSSFTYYAMFYERIKKLVRNSMEAIGIERINEFEVSYQSNAILGVIMEWSSNGFKNSVDEMNNTLFNILKRYKFHWHQYAYKRQLYRLPLLFAKMMVSNYLILTNGRWYSRVPLICFTLTLSPFSHLLKSKMTGFLSGPITNHAFNSFGK